MHKVEDLVVYPTHGIGRVEDIITRSSKNNKEKEAYYIIKINSTGVKILMPVGNAEKLGIREVSDTRKINKALNIIKQSTKVVPNGHWNRRQKEYLNKVKSGSIFEMAEVFRDLTALQYSKPLSFGEKRILENVENLLVSEIAESKHINAHSARMILKKSLPVLPQQHYPNVSVSLS
ncbi:MAG: CarD family transcriptional regulator [Nitrospinota bacterium]